MDEDEDENGNDDDNEALAASARAWEPLEVQPIKTKRKRCCNMLPGNTHTQRTSIDWQHAGNVAPNTQLMIWYTHTRACLGACVCECSYIAIDLTDCLRRDVELCSVEEHDGALLIATPTQHATHTLAHTLRLRLRLHKIDRVGKQTAPLTETLAICCSLFCLVLSWVGYH